MAVRQLHYTTDKDGTRAGAMTPGSPRALVELALRASGGPAFGYVPSGRGAVLFHSTHALLFDDVERELGDVLPIDLWRSPAWADSAVSGSTLPEVTSLAPGDETSLSQTRQFVVGRTNGLERVLSSTQRALVAGRGRLVLVVPDRSAALWLAATCRSLPHPLRLRISFTTHTVQPEHSPFLLSCTPPDVRVPSSTDVTAIDLTTTPPRDPNSTRYASAITQLWDRGEVPAALNLAATADPRLTAAELDTFAVLLEMAFDLPIDAPAGRGRLLAAVRLAVDRMPKCLPEHAWTRIADEVADSGPMDVVAWSEVVRTARHNGEPVPPKLLGTYLMAALGNRELWLPRLAPADLDAVAEQVVLPALTTSPPAVIDRLSEQRPLVDALFRVLNRTLTDQRETTRLATTLPPTAARLLASGPDPVRRLADVVLARHGALDPVRVLADAAVQWRHLGPVLWPEDLSTEDALELLRQVPAQIIIDNGLSARIAARALDEPSPELLDELLRSPITAQLDARDQAALDAARQIAYLRSATPGAGSTVIVSAALTTAASLPQELRHRLTTAAASFVLRATPQRHRDLLITALDAHGSTFLTAYRTAALKHLSTATPHEVATVVVLWRSLANRSIGDQLIDETLPDALRTRRPKHLNKIANSLHPAATALGVPPPNPNWTRWWQSWRMRHTAHKPPLFFRRIRP